MKITLETVSNGWVVRIVKEDVSLLKESYEKPVLVFTSAISLKEWLAVNVLGEKR